MKGKLYRRTGFFDKKNPQKIDNLTGIEFEKLIETLFTKMGFEVQTTKSTADGGIDLIAYSTESFYSGKYIVQCKRWTGTVGEPVLRDLYGVVMSERANKGILITNSTFSSSAINFANDKPLELIDGSTLKHLMVKYDINISDPSVSDDNSLKDIYEWEQISILRTELRNDPNNHNLRMQLIHKLSFVLYDVPENYSRVSVKYRTPIDQELVVVSSF